MKGQQRSAKPPESTSLSKFFPHYTDTVETILCWKLKYSVMLPCAILRSHQQFLTLSVLPSGAVPDEDR